MTENGLFKSLFGCIKKAGRTGLPMQSRLFALFVLFLISVMAGVLMIFFFTGIFRTGVKENRTLLEKELDRLQRDVSAGYGSLSAQVPVFASQLAADIEVLLENSGVKTRDLQKHPEMLEPLLSHIFVRLSSVLEKTKSSGVFVILDATVNPSLENAVHSRAGLYIKNMEPNIVSASVPTIRFLRGPASVSRKNGINLLPQWRMEFDTRDAAYFHVPVRAARKRENAELPLSRLYYWSPPVKLPDSENAMMCSVPLIDSEGTVFGVCGFEVSAMLFKLAYMPDSSTYTRIFCLFAPLRDGHISAEDALFAGSYPARSASGGPVSFADGEYGFNTYSVSGADMWSGLHCEISLYPSGSAFADERWILSLMMPHEDLAAFLTGKNRQLLLFLAVLMVLSIAISFLFSRKFSRPIVSVLDMVKSHNFSNVPHTCIPEIDDLIEFLTVHDSTVCHSAYVQPAVPQCFSPAFSEFVRNIGTLSTAERAVFNLYMKGHTAKEIAHILCLSINTIKTHNRRIYMKLNVTSRKELLVYVSMMEVADKAPGNRN